MRIYLREEPEVVAGKEDEYAQAVSSLVYPILEASGVMMMQPVGAFRLDTHYGSWPNFVFLWSYEDGFAAYAAGRIARALGSRDTAQMSHDPAMIEYVNNAGKWRQRSMEKLLVPLSFSPQPPPRPATTSANSLLLEHVFTVASGRGSEFIESVRNSLLPAVGECGLRLELFTRTAGRPGEYVALWSLPSWDAWADFQAGRDPADEGGFLPGYEALLPHLQDIVEHTLAPMPYSPLGGAGADQHQK